MTKKVTQNVTNSNSEDLTEQLHQGKLPDNHHYYYKLPNGKCEVGNTFCIETLHWCKGGDKIEVLEEVPDFDRWQAVLKYNKAAKDIIDTQAKENTKLKETISNDIFLIRSRDSEIAKLKELLKQARGCVAVVISRSIAEVNGIDTKKLLTKIDQVL